MLFKTLCALLTVSILATPTRAAEEIPPLPKNLPVLLAGHPDVTGSGLSPYTATFSMGRSGKAEGLGFGEEIKAGANQSRVFELATRDGKKVLRRSSELRRTGADQVIGRSSIDVDPVTLLPLYAETERGGNLTIFTYDWTKFLITKTAGDTTTEIALDLPMLEVGAHDIWVGALPLKEGFSARLAAVFAATGTKYWAVPRVVGSEAVDIGDGTKRSVWVVELDWWGMGAQNTAENYTPGNGKNNSAGAGGKYWVLKIQEPGLPRVVRIRTEIDADNESVIQLQ